MCKFNLKWCIAFIFVLFLSFVIHTYGYCSDETLHLTSFVTDNANILTPKTKKELTSLLEKLKETDSTEIAVVTINSLNGQSIEEYAINIAQANGIGQKGKDNGVLFLVAKNDHKMRIEVGCGLEGKLTDIICSHILNDDVKPYFKDGKYNEGIVKGVDSIIKTIKGEYKVEDTSPSLKGFIITIAIIFVILIMVGIFINFSGVGGGGDGFGGSSFSGSGGGGFGGGGFGGGGCSGGW